MARPKNTVEAETGNPVEAVKQPEAVVEAQEFTVSDPLVLRPKELELIIKPTVGGWKNKEQAEFAATLNGYAYKNPEKWAEKKDKLLAQLTALGSNPALITKLRGNDTKLSYSNELYKNKLGD